MAITTIISKTGSLEEKIFKAVEFLLAGKNIIFPTETVYGLGADITHPTAVNQIFQIKGRPSNHPLIVHFADIGQISYWAENVPSQAKKLIEHLWPGPLTLILPKSQHVPYYVTGGQDTVGLRIPDHFVAIALLRALGPTKAVVAPSANRFGCLSPTDVIHVSKEISNKVSMILDDGPCKVGLESTIISFCDAKPTLLRPGGIPLKVIEELLCQKISVQNKQDNSLRTPGMLASHYAPQTPLEVWPSDSLQYRIDELLAQNYRIAIVSWSNNAYSTPQTPEATTKHHCAKFSMPSNPIDYGYQLYAKLHYLDNRDYDRLLIEMPPALPDWLAVHDRLQRASYHFSKI